MNDSELVSAFVRYQLEGSDADASAAIELSQIAIDQPERAWNIIQRINQTPIEGSEWQKSVWAALGCGALEDLVALHEQKMLPLILASADADSILRFELSTIYESSISPTAWAAIRSCLTSTGP